MLEPRATARKTPTWPTPTPEQVEVVLLGTYHMAGSELDAVSVDADDVLADNRQRELDALVSNLERAAPDHVAVERPAVEATFVNDVYARYRDGEVTYGEARTFERDHDVAYDDDYASERDDGEISSRNEAVQIGFRLAARLGHDRVVPVDVPAILGTDPDFEALESGGFEPTKKIAVPRLDHDDLQEALDERLAAVTLPAYHRYLNEEAALHHNDGMFERFLRYGDGDNYAGPDALSRWYRRNLRMIHNVWRAVDVDTDRVLLVVGAGHVHVLRHLLTECPQFCPVSPLPYLPRDG